MKIAAQRQDATELAGHFALTHPVDTVEWFGKGLINHTFLVTAGGRAYILQRINDAVFPKPEQIMANLAVLDAHLATASGADLRIPALIPARDGRPFARSKDGAIWRLMEFIPNTRGLAQIDDQGQALEVGRILGQFHALTRNLPPARLAVTLPGFHVTPAYLEHFTRVLDGCTTDLADETRQCIAFATTRRGGARTLEEARKEGRIPLRVIHGDPKLDNILFDRTTGRAVSLIDLDTVQPGLLHYDIGDCLRSCCNRGGESADENQGARFDLDLCQAILSAYADETRSALRTTEVELIFHAIRLIPFELGLRFLTDHLEGDRYFRVTEPGQNLRKARVQFSLVKDIEGKEQEIRRIVAECFPKQPTD